MVEVAAAAVSSAAPAASRRSRSSTNTKKVEVLLDDSIFPGGPPPDFAGRLYHYHVVKYNGEDDASDEDAAYVLRYEGKCIMPDGNTNPVQS